MLLDVEHHVKICDFGLSGGLEEVDGPSKRSSMRPLKRGVRSQAVAAAKKHQIGTPPYMAPELWNIKPSAGRLKDAKHCAACGKGTVKADREVCKHCRHAEWVMHEGASDLMDNVNAKHCAACGKGTVKAHREACKFCHHTQWIMNEGASTALKKVDVYAFGTSERAAPGG